MPGSFAYTRSTNTLVVTGGTSGSPADFASMLTADRAGSVTLLAAWTPNSNTKALTYQIAPAEVLALLISFVVASKTTEADYIFITGTDAWGGAQTESLDVSAGNGTYTTTKRFQTITNIDCSDGSGGGGTVWADGTVQVTQPQWGVVWNSISGQFRIDATVNIGDGSTSTYFTSLNEQVLLSGSYVLNIKSASTLQLGSLAGGGSTKNGSTIVCATLSVPASQNASVIIYDSKIRTTGTTGGVTFLGTGAITIQDAAFEGSGASQPMVRFASTNSSVDVKNLKIVNFYSGLINELSTAAIENLTLDAATSRFANIVASAADLACTYDKTYFLGTPTNDFVIMGINRAASANLIDSNKKSVSNLSMVTVGSGTVNLNLKFRVNLKVLDAAGDAIESATVSLVDQYDSNVFSVATDGSGDIAEQIVTYKNYTGSSATLTTYSPHVLTISKAGYKTLTIPAITIDSPINWSLELQPIDEAPAPWEA